jgi:hypothetical protein
MLILESAGFMEEHDDRRRGEVDSLFAEMEQHRMIRYAIMLQAQRTDVIGRNQDRQGRVGDPTFAIMNPIRSKLSS